MTNNNLKIEKLAKAFSSKLADNLEKGKISLDETRTKIHNFLILAKEEKVEEMEKMINEI